MTEEQKKELLSTYFISTIGSYNGFKCEKPDPDHGIDLRLTKVLKRSCNNRDRYYDSGNTLNFQLKATSCESITREPEETVVVDYSGRIIEMKSKNPQGDNNSVTIQTDVQNEEKPKKITVCLNNEDYQMAIDAHKDNLLVHITGIAKQLKNSLKIQDLTGFSLHTENR